MESLTIKGIELWWPGAGDRRGAPYPEQEQRWRNWSGWMAISNVGWVTHKEDEAAGAREDETKEAAEHRNWRARASSGPAGRRGRGRGPARPPLARAGKLGPGRPPRARARARTERARGAGEDKEICVARNRDAFLRILCAGRQNGYGVWGVRWSLILIGKRALRHLYLGLGLLIGDSLNVEIVPLHVCL